jgi:hypothetical protein
MAKYRCKICGEVFESTVGKGNKHGHMSKHGYNLKGAIYYKKVSLVPRSWSVNEL